MVNAKRYGMSNPNAKHCMSNHELYSTWKHMIDRCHNPRCREYIYYGARGISVCPEWHTIEGFVNDMGKRPEGLSLDRIDNDKGYSKENCRWATRREQMRNTRKNKPLTHNGITLTLPEWSENIGISRQTIQSRIRLGYSIEDILSPKLLRSGSVPRIKKI